MKKSIFIISLFMFLQLPFLSIGQNEPDSTNLTIIETKDGNQYIGLIINENDEQVQLETEEVGVLTILKKNISKRQLLGSAKVVAGKIWTENNQPTRYFWSPTGYGLKKGEGYYQNLWVLFNQVSFGLTDNFSIGLGLVPLFLFSPDAAEYSPIWITPKFSIPIKKDEFNLGVGLLAGTAGFQDEGGFGIAYGVGTFGDRNSNLSFGIGYGYAGGDWANRPVINIGAMIRTGPRGYLLTENYMFPGDETLILCSVGGRTITRSISLDYGLFLPLSGADGFIAFPWLGLNVPFKFGNKTPSK